jgi:predicted metal-dependent HD superfamily phosphohydrolase
MVSQVTILVDPARWPAHGQLWAHLVSDHSLAELHAFAHSQRLARRRFDLDHYDVREDELPALVAAGAVAVTGHELARRLEASGLRIPQARRDAERAPARLAELRAWWADLGDDSPAWADAGERLLARWQEPHRGYHDAEHLHDVLLHLDLLWASGAEVPRVALLAAWYHDAVYEGAPGADERASAKLARAELLALGEGPAVADQVARLILSTDPSAESGAMLEPGDEDAAGLLGDADLAILAAPDARYRAYVEGVRREYAHVPPREFVEGRLRILQDFLARRELFRTPTASKLWDQRARMNLTTEIRQLSAERSALR